MADTPMRKFMFERSFADSTGHVVSARDRRPVTLTPEQVDALKKEAHDAGFAAGRKSAAEDQAQYLNVTVTQIAGHIAKLLQQTEADRQEKEVRVREAVLAIARKVLPDFNQRHGLQEIEAIIAGIIGEMSSEPRLVVRVNETQFDSIDGSVKSITTQQGYAGKVVFLADPDVAPNDCRVEWADGGIERNLESLWRNIAQAVAPGADISTSSPETADQEIKNG
ncbi:MAG: FliH/SctL family protein [Bdellovibrionales bacterium]